MHLGHMIPFVFKKWLQDVFDVPLVQLTDKSNTFAKAVLPKSKKGASSKLCYRKSLGRVELRLY
ncbi:hypothetical protein JAAARDRAFT_628433 [Jaapia argillacea MUCL 33604]|uniref:Uncharacterized protein n=1 Tax=Jaapia argillacea MUCL 33604 TaxID=933084 RepID=A0A067Q839_9AGAM|nr:hypothetical protein JAAARDRAFT_628433 [Jaapia argillacea MUCL 33604]